MSDQRHSRGRLSLCAGFKYQIERGLCGSSEACEAALPRYVPQPFFTGLGAEREPDLLIQRCGRADHGGGRVVDASDRVKIILQSIIGKRLDQHASAVTSQCGKRMLEGAYRISHIVQAIKEAYEVVSVRRE